MKSNTFPINLHIGLNTSSAEFYSADDCSHLEKADRYAVRAVICDENGRICLIRTNRRDYKFPGGGVKSGEEHFHALEREVSEEAGLTLDMSRPPEPLARVVQQTPDTYGDGKRLFTMESLYYRCFPHRSGADFGPQKLDDYEAEQQFSPVFISPVEALASNEVLLLSGNCENLNEWVYRETLVLRSLIFSDII